MSQPDPEAIEQWALINTPLGEFWSGRTRYAAAMYFHKASAMSAETLEIYRICARLDAQDPLAVLAREGIGGDWLARMKTAGGLPIFEK